MTASDDESNVSQRRSSLATERRSEADTKSVSTVDSTAAESAREDFVHQSDISSCVRTCAASEEPFEPSPKTQPAAVLAHGDRAASAEHNGVLSRPSTLTEKSLTEYRFLELSGTEFGGESLAQSQPTNVHGQEVSPEATPHSGFLKSFTRMYGKGTYNAALAESWTVEHQESIQYPTKWTRALLLISAILPYTIGSLDHTIIATLIPTFITQFEKPADIGWYASSYFLPFALLMPTLGKCYSLWKIKWLFLSSLIFLIAGSMVCGLSRTSEQFIVGRTLSGSGAAGILQGSMRILALALPGTQRIYMEGIGAIIMGACIMSGPLIGGVIADSIGWQWAFWINIPPAAISFIAILFFFPKETPRTPLFSLSLMEKAKRLDPIGSALLIITLSCLISVLQDYSYSLTLTIDEADLMVAAIAGTAFVLFLAQEACIRPDLALMPRSMIRRRSVWSSSVMLFLVFAGFTNFVFFMSIFQQVVQGETATESALHMLPYVISATVAAGITSFGSTKVRYYNPFFVLGGGLFTIGMGFVSQMDDSVGQKAKFSYEILIGTGVGLMVLGNVAPCHIDLPEKDHAIANGVTGLGGALGASIAVPISSALFNRAFRTSIETLDIPLSVKLTAIENITMIHNNVPAQYLDAIIDTLVQAIQSTFLFGLGCAIACVVTTLAVPWQALKVTRSLRGQNGQGLLPFWRRRLSKAQ